MSCFAKINGVPYTKEELVEAVKTKGMSIFPSPENDLARSIFFKYDYESAPPSIMEVVYSTLTGDTESMPTKDQIQEAIYSSKAFSDYSSQASIHYNTYSGVRITGISALFGKMLGYMHESTPINTVIDPDGNEIVLMEVDKERRTSNLNVLLDKEGVDSVIELVTRKGYKVKDREQVKLKIPFRIAGGTSISELSREEIDLKTGQPTIPPHSSKPINVFETVDTIINLAIDNVKEMKLFVLGITNANANVYLTALSLGLPLDFVTKMFRTPTFQNYSSKRRIYTSDIQSDMESTAREILKAFKKNPSYFNNYPDGRKIATALSQLPEEAPISVVIDKLSVGISVENVDRDSRGEDLLGPREVHHFNMLANLKMLNSVGEEYFAYAQLYGFLRRLNSKKWRTDYVIRRINELTNFGSWTAKDSIEAYQEELMNRFKNTEGYKQASEEEQKVMEKEEMKRIKAAKPFWQDDAKELFNSTLMNQIIKKSIRKNFKPSTKSVFLNASPLTIPHVYSAYSVGTKFKRMVEQAFLVHNPLLQQLANNVKANIQVVSSYATEKDNEFVQEEFLKFLTSSLKLNIDGQELDLKVSKQKTKVVGEKVFGGVDAWAIDLVARVDKLKRKGTNTFLNELEISQLADGRSSLHMTSDKEADPEVFESIRDGFMLLTKTEPELALDIFKYAIISQGLGFGRSSLSGIFPDHYLAAFSRSMERQFQEIIPTNKKGETMTAMGSLNLKRLQNMFAYQFIRNYPSKIRYLRGAEPVKMGGYKNSFGGFSKILFGKDTVEGRDVYFDLKFKNPGQGVDFHPFINRFDRIYALVLSSEDYVYYREITSPSNTRSYTFSSEYLKTSPDITALTNPEYAIENSLRDSEQGLETPGGTLSLPFRVQKYQVGDKVGLVDMSTAFPEKVKVVTIEEVKENKGYFSYVYKLDRMEDTASPTETTEEQYLMSKYIIQGAARSSVISVSRERALDKLRKDKKNTLAIISDYQALDRNYENLLVLPLNDFTPENIGDIKALIDAAPKKKKIAVDSELLSTIAETNLEAAQEIAVALNEKFGVVLDLPIENEEVSELSFLANKTALTVVSGTILEDLGPKVNPETSTITLENDRFYENGTVVQTPNSPFDYAYVLVGEKVTLYPISELTLSKLEDRLYSESELNELIKGVC